jgi:hypothetical protein
MIFAFILFPFVVLAFFEFLVIENSFLAVH